MRAFVFKKIVFFSDLNLINNKNNVLIKDAMKTNDSIKSVY